MTNKIDDEEDKKDQISLFDAVARQVQEANQNEKYVRPSWDEYFMSMMEAISLRSTCDRGRSGCVITKDHQVLATGYVGSAAGDDHCDDVGHLYQKRLNPDGTTSNHCVRTVHAEQNALCQAAKRGVALEGGTLYCRMTPCPVCARMIVNCGIKRVVAQKRYHDGKYAEELFQKCGVTLDHMFDELEQYGNQK
ncbi:MAG: cytidine/deoxycytidylate deaminase family protein [Candidatus Berkelbacteria bacterium]|nr:cytidine/deoxycytidylate deaminase family protein [Candidatus Berkelbacteria bacterium]